MVADRARRFKAAIAGAQTGRVYLPLPFDPEEAWGERACYEVTGTIAGCRVRGTLERSGHGPFLWSFLGTWARRGRVLEPCSKQLVPGRVDYSSLPFAIAAWTVTTVFSIKARRASSCSSLGRPFCRSSL